MTASGGHARKDGPSEGAVRAVVPDCEDYGGIGPEEFERRIVEDNERRYGAIIRNAEWITVSDAGW